MSVTKGLYYEYSTLTEWRDAILGKLPVPPKIDGFSLLPVLQINWDDTDGTPTTNTFKARIYQIPGNQRGNIELIAQIHQKASTVNARNLQFQIRLWQIFGFPIEQQYVSDIPGPPANFATEPWYGYSNNSSALAQGDLGSVQAISFPQLYIRRVGFSFKADRTVGSTAGFTMHMVWYRYLGYFAGTAQGTTADWTTSGSITTFPATKTMTALPSNATIYPMYADAFGLHILGTNAADAFEYAGLLRATLSFDLNQY